MADHNFKNIEKEVSTNIKNQLISGFKKAVADATKEIVKEKIKLPFGEIVEIDDGGEIINDLINKEISSARSKIKTKKKFGSLNILDLIELDDLDLRSELSKRIDLTLDVDDISEDMAKEIITIYTVAERRAKEQLQAKNNKMKGLRGIALENVKKEKTFDISDIVEDRQSLIDVLYGYKFEGRNKNTSEDEIDSKIKELVSSSQNEINNILDNSGQKYIYAVSEILSSTNLIMDKLSNVIQDRLNTYYDLIDDLGDEGQDLDKDKNLEIIKKIKSGLLTGEEGFKQLVSKDDLSKHTSNSPSEKRVTDMLPNSHPKLLQIFSAK